MTCPSDNAAAIDQSSFWDSGTLNWDAHRIGWAIAGGCTALTLIISFFSVMGHCRNYTNRRQQRQMWNIRILYMPPVYAVISFLSYRFFRDYTYYSLVEVVYEALTISAFLLLLIEYVADSAAGHRAENALARKDKTRLLFPLCCWRYRPTKAYFMYTVKWSVLQYVIVRPAVSIAGIICQAFNVLCESASFSVHYANVYLEAVDFVSISLALYGLLLFYGLTKDELVGRRPLSKFLSIKGIVFFTFYQSFVVLFIYLAFTSPLFKDLTPTQFSALQGRVIKATTYWTTTNIANGLNALAICIEMIFFSGIMMWAFSSNEYKRKPGTPATSVWRPLWDSIYYADFAQEIWGSLRFYVCGASAQQVEAMDPNHVNFGEAFGVEGHTGPGGFKRRGGSAP